MTRRVRRAGLRHVLLVHDSGCAACSGLADRLRGVLAVPVLVRSCRDPGLAAEFPQHRRRLTRWACRRPYLLLVRHQGEATPAAGLAMWWHAALLTPPARWLPAAALVARAAVSRWRHRRGLRLH